MIFDEGIFDESLFEDGIPIYTLDVILQEIGKPASYQADALMAETKSVPYNIATLINAYPSATYSLDALLVMDPSDPKFQESIINAMIWSYGRAIEELSESIATMGLRLTLPNAVPEDLDLYWSKILGLKRRYRESDSDFRARLTTRLAIMKSSGTAPECQAIIDHILGLEGASRLEPYWPAEVRVCWTSPAAMRLAKANYDILEEALDDMMAAGTTWSTAFPFLDYSIDVNISGPHERSYQVDLGLSGRKSAAYLLRTDLFDQRSAADDLDALMETTHSLIERLDVHLLARKARNQQIDALIEGEESEDYQADSILQKRSPKNYTIDLVSMKKGKNYYRIDMLSLAARRGFYQVSTELVAA